MTNQEIFEMIDRFDRSTLQTLKISTQDFSLELGRGQSAGAPGPALAGTAEFTAPAPAREEGTAIAAPLVGTYYASASPEQAPCVAVGDKVEKGRTVCLIEAMKMMSEVPAPCDCVIEEVLKANGDLVSFGEPLFRYRPC